VLLVVIRLMGKRQIGEMEPFELVITLVISELACIPMADRSIPITFGIVAILTMFVIHQLILLLSKNAKMQQFISGKPVMVYDKSGINTYALTRLNMQVNDLLQALRVTNHFSFEEINYGILETNGQLSVVENKDFDSQQTLPVPVILDGKWDDDDMDRNGIDRERVLGLLAREKVKLKDVVVLTVDENNRVCLQSKGKNIRFYDVSGGKLINEIK
jgi:uncharacterized membrane protein YcaP (DUF421 family)